ncbi:MAG: histidine triad nucleotide-binding protein [Eggerthellaceae bacterium]|jgi:histidine triad (HIT) family protein
MLDDDCLFCKIIKGDIPSSKVYEDDCVLAFNDVNPQMPVHVLIVPKNHYVNLSDQVPADTIAQVFGTVPKVAKATGIDASGYRVIVNNGEDAKQVVKHLHVHVMGGGAMMDGSPAEDPSILPANQSD